MMEMLMELQEPFKYSWNLARALIIISIALIIVYIFVSISPRFYKSFFGTALRKTMVPSLRVRYIRKLEELLYLVNTNQINNKDAYTRLSLYIREFIKKASGINVLGLSKEEIKGIGIESLSLLMEEYYPPEFSKNEKGNIAGSIERSIEVIREWK
jgi:hypothetical protein